MDRKRNPHGSGAGMPVALSSDPTPPSPRHGSLRLCDVLPRRRPSRRAICADLTVIALLSVIAQMTHFSAQKGRTVINGDSAQYVANAEALVSDDKTPHFEMRKPAYSFLLAGLLLIGGSLGWPAIALNNLLIATLPLAAYGLGLHLRSRTLAWLAAVLTAVRLQYVVYGDRLMSEALYTCLLSFGLLLLVVGLSRTRVRWLCGAGCLIGLAWLTRASATAVMPAALAIIVWTNRRSWRRAVLCSMAFGLPVVCTVVFECSLNARYARDFKTSTSTAGASLLLRMRHDQGAAMPPGAAAAILSLLPERSRADAYIASPIDIWVARYHAVHDRGMDEWTYDRLMGGVALEMARDDPAAFSRHTAAVFAHHILRRPGVFPPAPELKKFRLSGIVHPNAPDRATGERYWFTHYALPHLSESESVQLVDRMKVSADQTAPFAHARVWSIIRYLKTKPPIAVTLNALHWLATLWPGFALAALAFVGVQRRTCAVLAIAYVLDALMIGVFTAANERMSFVWVVSDTTLAAALVALIVGGAIEYVRRALSAIRCQYDFA